MSISNQKQGDKTSKIYEKGDRSDVRQQTERRDDHRDSRQDEVNKIKDIHRSGINYPQHDGEDSINKKGY